jgi:hypothetical protein
MPTVDTSRFVTTSELRRVLTDAGQTVAHTLKSYCAPFMTTVNEQTSAINALLERVEALEQRPIGAVDAGLFELGKVYQRGDGITFDGGFWVAQTGTSDAPCDGSTAWRLAVRRGKAGREGRPCPGCAGRP